MIEAQPLVAWALVVSSVLATVGAVVAAASGGAGLSFSLAVVAAAVALLTAAATGRGTLFALSLVAVLGDIGVITYWAYKFISGLIQGAR